jgi:hypothetical protein
MVAGIISESRPGSNRNGGRDDPGIRRQHAAIYTDSKEKLADAIETRTGERQAAIASSRGGGMVGSDKPAQSRGMGMG